MGLRKQPVTLMERSNTRPAQHKEHQPCGKHFSLLKKQEAVTYQSKLVSLLTSLTYFLHVQY